MLSAIPFILLCIVGAIVIFFQAKAVRELAADRDDLRDEIDRRTAQDEEEAEEENEPEPDEIQCGSKVVCELGGFTVRGVVSSLYAAQVSGAGKNADTQYGFLIQTGTGDDQVWISHYNASYEMELDTPEVGEPTVVPTETPAVTDSEAAITAPLVA